MVVRSLAVSLPVLAGSLALLGCGAHPLKAPAQPEAVPTPAEPEALPAQGPPPAASFPAPSPAQPSPIATNAARRVHPASGAGTELADAARALAGSWRCSGAVYGPDGAPSRSEASLDVRLELDAAWLRTELAVSSGKHRYQFRSYRTFHPSSGEWVNVILDNLRGYTLSRSTDGVIWTGESRGPVGAMKIKDTETIVSPDVVNLLGQYSLDGTSWRDGYDLSCKRAAAS